MRAPWEAQWFHGSHCRSDAENGQSRNGAVLLVCSRGHLENPSCILEYAMYKHEYQQIKPNYTWNVIGSDVKKTVLVCLSSGASIEK